MAEDQDSEKSHEPSEKKLRDARQKGQVARSPDLLTATAYGGFLIGAIALGSGAIMSAANGLMIYWSQAAQFFPNNGSGLDNTSWFKPLLNVTGALWLFWVVPGLCVLAVLLATRTLIFSPSKLAPKLSRISLFENAKNKFGKRGLFEFSKSAVKLLIYCIILGIFIRLNLNEILASLAQEAHQIAVLQTNVVVRFLTLVFVVALVIAAVDFLWQHFEFLSRNRMSHKELRDEAKEAEGDPHQKSQRRARGEEIARQNIAASVPKADVIIVNPTHYAVALQWDSSKHSAPICVAKGVDEVAARIREIANESGVPIHSDPPVARAIHKTVEIGAEIQPELYRAVAAALRFAEAARVAKKRGV